MGQFKVGDVVRLRSGGPEMTAIQIKGDSATDGADAATVLCQWFSGDTLCPTAGFPAAALCKVGE